MIVVFAELGGSKLLGRAREIADSLGYGVTAICSDPPKEEYVSLGADELVSFRAKNAGEWIRALTSYLSSNKKARLALFPSNDLANFIAGGTSKALKTIVFLDNVELVSEIEASKKVPSAGLELKKRFPEDALAIMTVRLSSVAEPFEDTGRFGKKTKGEIPVESVLDTPSIADSSQSADELTILYGREAPKESGSLEKLSKKHGARLIQVSSELDVVYGPCLAVEVNSSLRDLPHFEGDLIALNSNEKAPILRVADLPIISREIEKILSRL